MTCIGSSKNVLQVEYSKAKTKRMFSEYSKSNWPKSLGQSYNPCFLVRVIETIYLDTQSCYGAQ